MKYKELIQRLKDTVYRGENIQEAWNFGISKLFAFRYSC